MRLVLFLQSRFYRTPDGAVWRKASPTYAYFAPFLDAFDEVRVVARTEEIDSPPVNTNRVDGEGVTFVSLPYFIGPMQYLRKRSSIRAAALDAVGPNDAVLFNVSSVIASSIEPAFRRSGRPYAVCVVGDPYDTFAPGSIKHPLRFYFRWWFPRELRGQCQRACAATYVTAKALQRRYPPGPETFASHFSDVDLPEEAYASESRSRHDQSGRTTLITVGTQEQLYKAPDVLIDAVAGCVGRGLDIELVLIGDGKHRRELEARTCEQAIGERVIFRGELPSGSMVRDALDQADLFVLPSHQEGLPRAMIEAMARALPCIGSTVGGIPELLPAEDLVPPGNVIALADKIFDVVTDSARMTRMSQLNLSKSREYSNVEMHRSRVAFCEELKRRTLRWSGKRGALG